MGAQSRTGVFVECLDEIGRRRIQVYQPAAPTFAGQTQQLPGSRLLGFQDGVVLLTSFVIRDLFTLSPYSIHT